MELDAVKREMAAEVCALLAFSAIQNNDRVGLIIFTDRIETYLPPRKGTNHALRVVREALFFVPEGRRTDLRRALEYLLHVVRKKSVVFLISDFLGEGYDRVLRVAHQKHDLIAVRTVDPRVRSDAHAAVRRVAENIAAAHDMSAEVEIVDGYPVTVNDGAVADEVLDTARWLVGEDHAVTLPAPVMGAEDFSYVTQRVPGAMAFLGTRPDGVSPADVAPNHSNRMVLDESAMVTGVALYAAAALRRLAG